jgi:hypothetical protein
MKDSSDDVSFQKDDLYSIACLLKYKLVSRSILTGSLIYGIGNYVTRIYNYISTEAVHSGSSKFHPEKGLHPGFIRIQQLKIKL